MVNREIMQNISMMLRTGTRTHNITYNNFDNDRNFALDSFPFMLFLSVLQIYLYSSNHFAAI